MNQNYGCAFCNDPLFDTVKTIKSDGSFQYWRRCESCGKNWMGAGKFLKADSVSNKELLAIVEDYRQPSVRCAVRLCTDNAVQEHHYLPKNIAARVGVMADDWPTGPLCHRHHALWHWYVEGFRLDEKLLRAEGLI